MTPYADAAYQDDYFGTRLHSDAWDQASATDRYKASCMATRLINALNYVNSKLDSDQENEFPRTGQSEVSTDIKDACCEIQLALLDGVDPELEAANLRVQSQGFSSVRATVDAGSAPEHLRAGIPSATGFNLLKPYLRDVNRELKLQRA